MRTKLLSALIAICGIGLGSLGAAPAQAYVFYPTPIILPAPVLPQDPAVTDAMQSLAAAKNQSDAVQAQVLAGVQDSPAYKQALALLNTAQDEMDQAKAAAPYSQEQISALATTILADENRLARLEQPALNASPEYRVANATVQGAAQSLQNLQQVISQQRQLAAIQIYQAQWEAEHAQRHGYYHERQPRYHHEDRFASQTWTAYRGR